MFSLWIVVTVEARLDGYRRLGMLTREQLCQRNEVCAAQIPNATEEVDFRPTGARYLWL